MRRPPLPLGSTIGILGGGQLGRMLTQAANKLGLKSHIYSDIPNTPATEVAGRCTIGAYDDLEALSGFARQVDVITYEFENVPVAAARHLESLTPVRPSPSALAVAQDRLAEKQFLADCDIPLAAFAEVRNQASLTEVAQAIGLPAILKTRFLGYDGKGQSHIRTNDDIASAYAEIDAKPAVLESFVPFAHEISVIAVRGYAPNSSLDAEPVEMFYDCPLNTHENGVLRRSVIPSPIGDSDITQAHQIARRILRKLDYIGVLAVEFFYMGTPAVLDAANAKSAGGQQGNAEESKLKFPTLLVNEIAPRVHNSGHWTMDGCAIDQFENHIRAVAGWPLGSTERHSAVEMTNLIGDEINDWPILLANEPTASIHIYGKSEARPGRKMGHINYLMPVRTSTKSSLKKS